MGKITATASIRKPRFDPAGTILSTRENLVDELGEAKIERSQHDTGDNGDDYHQQGQIRGFPPREPDDLL